MLELLLFNMAIKSYKSLKNFIKRWQRSNELSLFMRGSQLRTMINCTLDTQLLSTYCQIAYIYSEEGHHRSALDYYKRLLIRSWRCNNYKYEQVSYEGMAAQYFYLENKANHLELARQCQDRYLKGHKE